MVDSIARVRFLWDAERSRCRAIAYDVAENVLAEVTVEVAEPTRRAIWRAWGAGSAFRIEEIAERHIRNMLDLRH